MSLTKNVQIIREENFKMLLRDTKENWNKWKCYPFIGWEDNNHKEVQFSLN